MQQQGRITKHLEPIVVDVDTAIPLGLITDELLTNAYRYAFPAGSTGAIRVELRLHAGIVELAIGDTGIGLPTGREPSSTGLRLVEALAKQIGGTLTLPRRAGRTRHRALSAEGTLDGRRAMSSLRRAMAAQ